MERKPRGRCLIINNTFTYSPSLFRDGSEKDACRMEKLFTKFGFKCLVYSDLSAKRMMEVLWKVAQEELQKVADCLVVVLMSHGDTGIIYGNDNKPLYLNEISKVFNDENCPSLQGKPKVFFIQACRGVEKDAGAMKYAPRDRVDSQSAQDEPPTVPTWPDMCFCYASVENYVSYRHVVKGSWFLSAVCSVFSTHACDMHLLDLMLLVTAEVMKRASQHGYRQTPCVKHQGWRKHLHFNPGLPVDPIPQPTPCMEQQTMQI
ncbi:caspase-2-like isoform X2 [Haemaphysalis longicornis]|uniref:Caspase n=1 Tax=Haemaphysalis longicornis TaxID=44386 RepID=A0A9J6GPY9_HAELO|nr:hypothetical protein HPB48_021446 [Haemaphysalis longicornis]